MAEENVTTGNFETPIPEKTELERVQERIQNFKVQITPNVAQMAQLLMTQALQNPTKPEELDGYLQVRNELRDGLAEYQNQVESAQKRLAALQLEHEQQKQLEIAQNQQDLVRAKDAERKRRKTAESEVQKLEAILASHGINIDLDGDGQIGTPQTLKQAIAEQEKKPVSPAFAKARALNPEPTSTEVDLGTETVSTEFVAPPPDPMESWEKPEITLTVPEGAQGTVEFQKEVESVEQEAEQPVQDNKPTISDSNAPAVIEEELKKVEDAPKIRMVEEEDIADFNTPPAPTEDEEELVEVTIPTESELKGMTKSKIQSEARALGFDNVTTKSSKTKMIADFVESTEAFIANLQDSGEFVSAREGDETESDTDDRDGGYFK